MTYLCLAVALAIVLQVFADVHADNETEVDADNQTEVQADNQAKFPGDNQAEVDADNQAEVDSDTQTDVLADVQSGLELPKTKKKKHKKCKCCNCCPTGWEKYGTSCYKYFSAPLNWLDAQSVCVLHQGWLATIESAGENGFIDGIATDKAWIGGFRILPAVSPFWAWIDGYTFAYTNWATGEPNNEGGNQNCVQMYTDGYWDDVECKYRKAYVCEKRMF
eukprot:GFUD01027584.1.p1 GENE.GFUD01027584.1~~GFUD01027584.1.p1  ORF type:complete len:220 (-),score=33.53 GFUD01027584.1:291-950(-)